MSTEKPLDLTKPVQTRDGLAVRILCTDRKHPQYAVPVLGLVSVSQAEEQISSWSAEGKSIGFGHENGERDLVNVPPKVEVKRVMLIHAIADITYHDGVEVSRALVP